jgi:hypothetical protein
VIRIPAPWLKHFNRHKPKDYMITYEDLKDMIKALVDKYDAASFQIEE